MSVEAELFPAVRKSAIFSACRTYRYGLRRIWDDSLPPVLFVGLNPSTADEDSDDPTIRRCIRFARDWGYGGLLMGNVFAFRATNPKDLPRLDDPHPVNPVGEWGPWERGWRENVNDKHLRIMAREAGLTIAAWGATPMPYGWDYAAEHVRSILYPLHALKLTKDGHPWHPLYVKADTQPIPLPAHEHAWGPWVMYEQSQEGRSCTTCGARQWD